MTSRWLSEVAQDRELEVRWRTFSLERRDGGELSDKIPEHIRAVALAGRTLSRRAMRVFEAVRARESESAVGDLYTALGCRLFVPGVSPAAPSPDVLMEALAVTGLPPSLEAEADVASWDEVVQESMDEAFEAVGADA